MTQSPIEKRTLGKPKYIFTGTPDTVLHMLPYLALSKVVPEDANATTRKDQRDFAHRRKNQKVKFVLVSNYYQEPYPIEVYDIDNPDNGWRTKLEELIEADRHWFVLNDAKEKEEEEV